MRTVSSMKKRKVTIAIMYAFIATILLGCMNKIEKQNPDSFYENISGYDWMRIPLIKPYEIKTNPQDSIRRWDMAFVKLLGTYNVKKVDIKDSIIYILSGNIGDGGNTFVNRTIAPTGWFIIDTKVNKEKGFVNEKDFNDYVINHSYPRPSWMCIDSLANVIIKKNKLPWRRY